MPETSTLPLITPDILVYDGGAIKLLDEFKDATGRGFRFGGKAVVFGDETKTDKSPFRDFMTPQTDYWIEDDEWGTPSASAPVIFHHGLDATLKKLKLGRATYKKSAADIWAEGVLKLRKEYEEKFGEYFDHIKGMVEKGQLGLSTGVPGHLVEREKRGEKAHWLKLWPLDRSELSLTPTPAEPRTMAVALKTLMESEASESSSTTTVFLSGSAPPESPDEVDADPASRHGVWTKAAAAVVQRAAEMERLGPTKRKTLEEIRGFLSAKRETLLAESESLDGYAEEMRGVMNSIDRLISTPADPTQRRAAETESDADAESLATAPEAAPAPEVNAGEGDAPEVPSDGSPTPPASVMDPAELDALLRDADAALAEAADVLA